MCRSICRILIAGVLLGTLGCGDKEQIELLTHQKATLDAENHSLKNSLTKLRGQVVRAEEINKRLDFLRAQMGGLHARIVTSLGEVELRLFPEDAPIHCLNFVSRAEGGFYDQTQFHRVIPGFMIQGGDPNTKDRNPYNDGQGGPVAGIPHEFNHRSHKRGVLSMARVGDVSQGAGCQFFIMHGDATHLDGQYTIFGEVVSGMEVVDRIATAETHQDDPRLKDHPKSPVVLQSIEVFKPKG